MSKRNRRGRPAPLILSALLLILVTPVSAVAAGWQPFATLDSVSYNEPFSVYAAFNEYDGGLSSGDEAFTHNQAEIGVTRGAWSLSLLRRYDYSLSFESATAELLHHKENDLPVGADRDYAIALRANHINAQGVKVRYAMQAHEKVTLGLALSYLRGRTMLVGSLLGDVSTDDEQSFSGDAALDYWYSEDVLLHRPVAAPDGHGYSVDLDVNWQMFDNFSLAVRAQDLFNAIYWRDAPFTRARLTSATVDLDDRGFINTTPLLAGVEGEKDFRQSLPVRTRVNARYRINDAVTLELQDINEDSVDLVSLGLSVRHADASGWGLFYDTTARAVIFNAEHRWFQVSLGMDKLDYKRAHYLQFAASVNFRI